MKLELKDIVLGYKGGEPLCSVLNVETSSGSSVAIVGRNGVGKSTLLRSVAGIVAPRAGRIVVDGHNILAISHSQRAKLVSFVSTEIISTAYTSVEQIVALGRSPYSGWAGRLSERDRQVVEWAMQRVDVTQFAARTVDTLSDGQRQRVMVARALAQDTPVVVLDEPTAFLDWENREMVITLLSDLAVQTGKIIIFSTHERDLALRHATHVWQLTPQGIEHLK